MPKVDVWNLDHEKVGELDLAEEVFGADVNRALLYEAVRYYLARQRAGTHATKTRGEVKGSGRKLWRQKGTGRARIGSIRSSLWRHGGTTHGPHPRDYSYRLPKKMLRGALRSALSAKMAENKLTVVAAFDLSSHKTKEFAGVLKRFRPERPVLLVDATENRNLVLSSRNVEDVEFRPARKVNAYDLLRHGHVLISQPAVMGLEEALRK